MGLDFTVCGDTDYFWDSVGMVHAVYRMYIIQKREESPEATKSIDAKC